MKAIPDILKVVSRELRKTMTKSEKLLWEKLRAKRFFSIKFQRQSPIYVYTENSWLDRYVIPDFICFENKIIIELDWNIHDIDEVYNLDKVKEDILESLWYRILRFRNEEVYSDIEEVLKIIYNSSLNSYSFQEQEAAWLIP